MKIKLNPKSLIKDQIILQLYITGMSENSVRAIQNITQLRDQHPETSFDLQIIDIYKNPAAAEEQQIVYSPSLVRQFPLPKKIFIGDLSDTRKVILGLGIPFNE
jgi:circadian clock protein KaiB